MKNKFRDRATELLIDLADHASTVVMELTGLDKPICDQIGQELSKRMAGNWGGQGLYFPSGYLLKVDEDHRKIYQRFNGSNHAELVKEFGVSLQHVYRVVKSVGAEELADRQGGLFPENDLH